MERFFIPVTGVGVFPQEGVTYFARAANNTYRQVLIRDKVRGEIYMVNISGTVGEQQLNWRQLFVKAYRDVPQAPPVDNGGGGAKRNKKSRKQKRRRVRKSRRHRRR